MTLNIIRGEFSVGESVKKKTHSRLLHGLFVLFLSGFFQVNIGQGDAWAQADKQDFKNWLVSLREDARAAGVSENTLDLAFRDFQPIERVFDLNLKQPEYVRTFLDYLGRVVNDRRVALAREMMRKHKVLLDRVSRQYGVQSRFLVAFWGLETDFGGFMGGFSAIRALATLAQEPRRGDFFRAELIAALQILDQGHIELSAMESSWAGAMGHVQFMPRTFRAYAVDDNGNGRKDIWAELPDALASAANYLSAMGWKSDETWGREVIVPAIFDWSLARLSLRKPLREWQDLGIRKVDGGDLPSVAMASSLFLPMGHKGPAFLVYGNYDKILKWNSSNFYALAVGHFADRIAGQPALRTAGLPKIQPLARTDVVEIQNHLNRLGYAVGDADGIPGRGTREGIRRFQGDVGLPADGYADYSLLEVLRGRKE